MKKILLFLPIFLTYLASFGQGQGPTCCQYGDPFLNNADRYDCYTSTTGACPEGITNNGIVTGTVVQTNAECTGSTPNATTGLCDWTSSSGSSLPVKFAFFYVRNVDGGVMLSWQTLSELNNEGFDVEYSTDGLNWEKRGFVSGAGSSGEATDYNFLFESPSRGVNYFRLMQKDYNGLFTYTKPVYTVWTEGDTELLVVPSLVSTYFQVFLPISLIDEPNISIQVLDLNGAVVRNINKRYSYNVNFNVEDLSPGNYIIKVQANDFVQLRRFVKS